MVKTQFLRMAVLALLGLGGYQSGAFAQEGVAHTSSPINVMATTGYSLSTNKARSDYFYASGHVDFDVGNYHRFYPLAELNYTMYTTNGNNPNFGSEGRDLINFGGQARGNNMLSAAFGARGKITESAQVGAAFEIPIAGNRDLFRYRFTMDFVLKY